MNGSLDWSGAFGTHFWVNRDDQLVGILLIQEPVTAMRGDFENAVIQSIISEH
jgi:CubicO group peptidase (beta-lactamase class C family)